jgi:hypothetical protein
VARPEEEWLKHVRPELRIVSEAQWTAAHPRLTGIRQRLAGATRRHAVCANAMVMRMERINEAVLQTLGGDVLRPAVVQAYLHGVFEALRPRAMTDVVRRAIAEVATIECEIARLTDAIATGGHLESLIVALKARQARRETLRHTITAADEAKARHIDRKAIERAVPERLARWRGLLTSHVEDGRELLRQVLIGPIRFRPDRDGRRYHFDGEATFGHLFSGVIDLACEISGQR